MPQNSSSSSLMRDALLDSLVDMSPAVGSIVCDHGRSARLIESLVLTDTDPVFSHGAVNLEQMRNDAFAQSSIILQECIKDASENKNNPKMVNVANVYNGVDGGDIDPVSESEFKDIVKGKVKAYINKAYTGKMTTRDHERLLDHCTVAIDTL